MIVFFCAECNQPTYTEYIVCDFCMLKAIRMPLSVGKALEVANANRERVDSLATYRGFNLAEKTHE